MPLKRPRFRRFLGERRYRKLFVIAVEGTKTEPQYFGIFNGLCSVIHVNCLKSNHSSPLQVLKRMEACLKQEALKETDEAWLVVDKDAWNDEQLAQLFKWSQNADNLGFALSNPKFEYWLLLHFEEGAGISSSRECSERLRRHLPDYDKGIEARKFSRNMIANAIRRAKLRDNPPCIDWPRTIGNTTVYKLAENILAG